jgi:hypothetical protein
MPDRPALEEPFLVASAQNPVTMSINLARLKGPMEIGV